MVLYICGMKKLSLLLLIVPVLGYGQGEQRYADDTATDQDGNTFELIKYGTQDWAIENAEVVNYRDGTEIPQVADSTEWSNLTTGAWCYYANDLGEGKIYNWYAVAGIHDNDPNTPNKEFAPEGWHLPSDAEWTTLENYLIDNGYNYDGTTTENKIAKSMASITGWDNSTQVGAIGNDQSLNNSSGFNAFPEGYRNYEASFKFKGEFAIFWNSTEFNSSSAMFNNLNGSDIFLDGNSNSKTLGFSVRFLKDASTASTNNYSNAITIYPNPTSSLVALNSDKEYNIEVYDMSGNKVLAGTGNNINMEHLSAATYIVKAIDKANSEQLNYKVVKN